MHLAPIAYSNRKHKREIIVLEITRIIYHSTWIILRSLSLVIFKNLRILAISLSFECLGNIVTAISSRSLSNCRNNQVLSFSPSCSSLVFHAIHAREFPRKISKVVNEAGDYEPWKRKAQFQRAGEECLTTRRWVASLDKGKSLHKLAG